MTETSTKPSPILLEEDNDTEETEEQKKETTFEYTEKKFITSPTDIDLHRKVDLQDAEVTKEEQQASFKTCYFGTERVRNSGRGRSDSMKCLSLG